MIETVMHAPILLHQQRVATSGKTAAKQRDEKNKTFKRMNAKHKNDHVQETRTNLHTHTYTAYVRTCIQMQLHLELQVAIANASACILSVSV